MIAAACALASAIGFYVSLGLGEQWWAAWLAPIPVLWLAFGEAKAWQVFAAAWLAVVLGSTNLMPAYGRLMPLPVLATIIAVPALWFALSVLAARRVQRALGPVAAMLAFAASWTAFDFGMAFSKYCGSALTPAAVEAGSPLLIQIASLVGFVGVTFLLGLVAAGVAASICTRTPLAAAIAVTAFCANLAFGCARTRAAPDRTLRTALIDSNDAVGKIEEADRSAALAAVDGYVAAIEKLRGQSIELIVLPENIAQLAPQWRDEVKQKLARAAADVGATLVAGFNAEHHNIAFALSARADATYAKRRLIIGLETVHYEPGTRPLALGDGTGVEICKDMDFHAMVRDDMLATAPVVLAVPAWDFTKDDWSHARVAVLRSVENGVAMARAARNGLLTLNDRYGRVVARARTAAGFVTLVDDLPIDGRGGATIYDRIGDVFGWLCVAAALALQALAFRRRRR